MNSRDHKACCCYYDCSTATYRANFVFSRTYVRFTADESQKLAWRSNLRIDRDESVDGYRVWIGHFHEEDILIDPLSNTINCKGILETTRANFNRINKRYGKQPRPEMGENDISA